MERLSDRRVAGLWTSVGLANAVFSFLTLMSMVTYGMTVYRDPWHIPLSYMPDIEDPENPIQEIKRKVLGPNILCWMCPVSRYIGSGLRFQASYDTEPSTMLG